MDNTTRFAHLLGECRRQMNGAVADSMRYYGDKYGLNYGVSIPTLRSLARLEGKDHSFARHLYLQQVREIRIVALHIAQPNSITAPELDFWAAGIINSEVAEEAAFALFQYVESVEHWLISDNELLIYTALLSLAKNRQIELEVLKAHINYFVTLNSMLLSKAIVAVLASYRRCKENQAAVDMIVDSLEPNEMSAYITEEMEWRKQFA